MLHARKDYNRRIQDSEGVIPGDEPVLLIRGQDKHAPQALLLYSNLVVNGPSPDMVLVENVRKHAEAMRKYQADNECAKEPDMNPADALYPTDGATPESEEKDSEETADEEGGPGIVLVDIDEDEEEEEIDV